MNSLPEERISELISEGMKKGAHVFLFDASHIDMEQEVIHGTFREGNSWVQRNVPLPDVVLNEAPEPGQNRPECEDWLRRRVPFTTFLIHGKYDIQKKLEPLFKDYLIPTECLQDPDQFLAYLDAHGEVIEFRIHIQRDGTGRWALTQMYARTGNTDSIISNISKGGRIEDAADLLYRLFPSQADRISREMERLAIRIAETINRSYSFLIDELGMDFIVTPEGRIYFVEANVSPPTPSHEQVRAARAIEYAHYVAKAGQLAPHPVIAMLTNDPNDKQLANACAYSAKWNNAAFYYFAPHDVHAELRYIKGYILESGEWEARYCPFPDVVYDRLKARGNTNYSDVYEALRHIPFTDERNEGSFSKKEVFEILQNYAELSSHLIPYTAVENVGEVQKFVRSETRNGLPYHIRLHLVRNGSGEWSFISAFPFLSTPSEYKVVNDAGSLRAFTTWDCLSRHEFPNKEKVMLMRLERMASMTADHIAGHVRERICELAIDVGIDSLGEIWIFEVNMNKIDSTHREFEVAQHMIPFALSLR